MSQGKEKSKILIVDDASEVVSLCASILQSLGYAAKGASGGQEAFRLLRQEPFDLMIIDYKMPEMNGFEVFREARVLRPDISCMLLTGQGGSDIVEAAAELGFDRVLLKPFTREQLRTAVADALQVRG